MDQPGQQANRTSPAGHCPRCGWPRGDRTCPACGVVADWELPRVDPVKGSTFTMLRPDSFPALQPAFDAWNNGEAQRFIGQCLRLLDVTSQVKRAGAISRWAFVRDSAVVYITFNHDNDEVSIESPLVLVPTGNRVGLYRTLLEMNDSVFGDARFCLRNERVVLKISDRLDYLAPPRMLAAIEEVASLADRFDNVISISFNAPLVGPKAQEAQLDWRFLGEAVEVSLPGAVAEPSPAVLTAAEDAAKGLLGIIRETQQFQKAAGFMASPGALPYLVHRAAVFRVWVQYGQAFPEAVRLLMREAAPFIDDALEEGDSRMPNAYSLANVYLAIVNHQGRVEPGDAPNIKRITEGGQIKAHFGRLLVQLDKDDHSAALQHFVLMGLLAEALVRVPMRDDARAQAQQLFVEAGNSSNKPEAVNKLWAFMRRFT